MRGPARQFITITYNTQHYLHYHNIGKVGNGGKNGNTIVTCNTQYYQHYLHYHNIGKVGKVGNVGKNGNNIALSLQSSRPLTSQSASSAKSTTLKSFANSEKGFSQVEKTGEVA